ncbi:MAG TPA: hypothetical protein VGK35_10950 [Actinotalea sp.]
MPGGAVGWQLTTLFHRARGRGVTVPVEVPPAGGDLRLEVATDRRRALTGSSRAALDSLLGGSVDAQTRLVVERTLAGTGSIDSAARMAQAWGDLPERTRSEVLDPVRTLARAGRQSDQTTCGSSALTMLIAAGDPTFALWLSSGRLITTLPVELRTAPAGALASLADAPQEARFAAVQRVMKRRSNSGAVLGLPWPSSLGTPPWGAARAARFPGVTYRPRMLDDTDGTDLRGVLAAVGGWVDRQVPVPLYSGGDSAGGWSTALPRHVVLAIGRSGSDLVVWEPSAGSLETVAPDRLVASTGPVRALGGWSHLMWAVLPHC